MAKVQSHGGKAAYMCIGSTIAAPHHNDHFNFDEASLLTGLRLYVSTVWEILHKVILQRVLPKMCPNTFPHPVQLLAAIYIFARVRIKNKAMEQLFHMFHGF